MGALNTTKLLCINNKMFIKFKYLVNLHYFLSGIKKVLQSHTFYLGNPASTLSWFVLFLSQKIFFRDKMKRSQPLLTSSGVRRRARFSLEKRLHEIAEDCQLTSEQTVANKADTCHNTNDNDSNNDCHTTSEADGNNDSHTTSEADDDNDCDSSDSDNSDGHTDIEWAEGELVSESDAEELNEHVSLLDSLASWAIQFSVSLVALTALLSLLRVYHPELPKDARTILKTKMDYRIQEKCGGLYHYRGILKALHNTLTQLIVTSFKRSNEGTCCYWHFLWCKKNQMRPMNFCKTSHMSYSSCREDLISKGKRCSSNWILWCVIHLLGHL